MVPGEIHNIDNAKTSNTHAAFITRRSEPFLKKLEELETRFSADVIINNETRVPTISRTRTYTHQGFPEIKPRVVSIGPFFHGEEYLKDMQGIKEELMFDLLSRSQARVLLPNLIHKIEELLEDVKRCYSGIMELVDDEFAQMLLIDSCFIIHFLISTTSTEMYESFSLEWKCKEIRSDLLLTGNQIPLFVVRNVYNIIQRSCAERMLPREFADILEQFIGLDISWDLHEFGVTVILADHLLDLYWLYFTPDEGEMKLRLLGENRVNTRLRDGYLYVPMGGVRNIPSATELNRVAGVIFKQDKSNYVARFHKGIFKMSSLKIDESMKIIIKTLLEYEKRFPLRKRKISSYMLLMDALINTEEDVAFLQECGIIYNGLDTHSNAAVFFNEIGNICTVDYANHQFAKLFTNVERHYKSKWKRRYASLRRDYCNSPWARISVVAAGILLFLAFTQTYFTVFPPK